MSPVSPVFHTEVTVTIGLKNQSRVGTQLGESQPSPTYTKRNPIDKALNSKCGYKPQIKSQPQSYIAGLRQVVRHITMSTVLTKEEILEEGG